MTETLETTRLLLRKVTPEVYEQVFDRYTTADAMAFFGCASASELLLEKQKLEQGLRTYRTTLLVFHLVEKHSGRTIGKCGYHTWYPEHARAEIGYGLFADSDKNKGFMKEAFLPVLRYGFTEMQLNRVEALISPANEPSQRLVLAHGFREEGRLREHYCKNGHLEDSIVFALLKKEFNIISYQNNA